METPSKILYVEDDSSLANVVSELLKSMGLEAETVTTLAAAEKALTDSEFDVILLDLNLPDAKWPESLDRLQSGFPDVPVVVVTGSISRDLIREALYRGAQEVILKPAKAEQIEEAVIKAKYRHQVRKIFAPIEATVEKMQAAIEHAGTTIDALVREQRAEGVAEGREAERRKSR